MDKGVWRAAVHGVTKSWVTARLTQSNFFFKAFNLKKKKKKRLGLPWRCSDEDSAFQCRGVSMKSLSGS